LSLEKKKKKIRDLVAEVGEREQQKRKERERDESRQEAYSVPK
jgi:hypothetical protein